jgi:hypothetical protein
MLVPYLSASAGLFSSGDLEFRREPPELTDRADGPRQHAEERVWFLWVQENQCRRTMVISVNLPPKRLTSSTKKHDIFLRYTLTH